VAHAKSPSCKPPVTHWQSRINAAEGSSFRSVVIPSGKIDFSTFGQLQTIGIPHRIHAAPCLSIQERTPRCCVETAFGNYF
jgi:hypothetical protein